MNRIGKELCTFLIVVLLISLLPIFNVGSVSATSNSTVTASTYDPVTDAVYFADPVFEGIIRSQLGIPTNSPVTRSAMIGITNLNVDGKIISSFNGLQYATKLNYMEIDNSTVTDATYLKSLTSLTQFVNHGSKFPDHAFLNNLNNLKSLIISDQSNITSADLSVINNLTNLNLLILERDQVSDLSALNNNASIKELIIDKNNFSDISFLRTMPSLEVINANDNVVSMFPDLSNLSHLKTVTVSNNKIDFNVGSNNSNLSLLKNKGVNVNSLPQQLTPDPPSSPQTTVLYVPTSPTSSANVVSSPTGGVDYNGTTKINNSTAEITLDDIKLNQAFSLLQSQPEGKRVINVKVNKQNADNINVTLSGSVVESANINAKGTLVNIQDGKVSYALPLEILSGINSNSKVSVSINQISTDVEMKISDALKSMNAKTTDHIYEFKIIVTSNGTENEVKDFGSVYVTRTIKLDQNVNEKNYMTYTYDPATSEISPAPATINKTSDGTFVEIKRNGNSVYGVAQVSPKNFTDINSHWAKEDIELLSSKMIIDGKTNDLFAPNDRITRAELSKIIIKSLGITPKSSMTSKYTDVVITDWYSDYVNTAYNNGLLSGYGDGTFRPNKSVTREEMAVIYSNILGFLKKSSDASKLDYSKIQVFDDAAQVSDWSKIQMLQLLQLGIIEGRDGNKISPRDNTTRAEIVVSLTKLLQYIQFID